MDQVQGMKDESYIISFPQGASGRFVEYLLYNLLTESTKELELMPETNLMKEYRL